MVLMALLIPWLATLAYGFSERWDRSIWPEGLTLRWFAMLAEDARTVEAIVRTLLLAGACATLALVAGTAASLGGLMGSRRLVRLLKVFDLLPYALPAVVIAVGALDVFIGRGWAGGLPLWAIYVLCATPLLLPVVHKAVAAAWSQLDAGPLLEASRTLGAGDGRFMLRVMLPLLAPQLLAAWLLSWVTAAMEFAIANLLLGAQMELLQPLMNGLRNTNGHQVAALVAVSFILVAVVATLVQGLMSWNERRS
ncbi:MAG TPA: ABC transporter permease subunit [Burkholderiaceae bacterium]|nr:ABC transporter permease subunit [Burkholderiaceae bacterium]